MYLANIQRKNGEKCFAYDISRGIEGLKKKEMGRVISALNYKSGDGAPLVSIGELLRCNYPSYAMSIGNVSGHIYYNSDTSFYFDGVEKGKLSLGRKAFVNFGDRIYIFPDRRYYDIKTDIFDSFDRSVTSSQIQIYLNKGEFEASYSLSSYGNLAEYFAGCSSIMITGSRNGVFDGKFKINSIDAENGIIRYGHSDVSIPSTAPGTVTISAEAPPLEGACVCKNRIIGYIGNKIYVSEVFEPMSWCEFGGERSPYIFENIGGEPFTACDCIDDQPVFFTKDSVYKVYGENATEYSLRFVSGAGGIDASCSAAHTKIAGEIYFLCGNSIVKFTGTRCDTVAALDWDHIENGIFSSYENKLYLCGIADGRTCFYTFDVVEGCLCEMDIGVVVGFLNINGVMYAATRSSFIPLEGKEENVDFEFIRDKDIVSMLEFEEIHNGFERFSPSKLIFRGNVTDGGEIDVYCMLGNSGEWTPVYKITDEGERLREISIPSVITDSFRLKIEGKGKYSLKNIYVIYS